MTNTQTGERLVPLTGAFNFRDLGGYVAADGQVVRWGRVYRADALHALTADDLAAIDRIGLRTVIDLRSHTEVTAAPHPFPAAGGVRYRHAPLSVGYEVDPNETKRPPDYSAEWLYRTMIDLGGEAIRVLFEEVADPEATPLVFHCTAGKDRTGVAAALLLRALGVPDEMIGEDYAISQLSMPKLIERLTRIREASGQPPPAISAMIEARAEMLEVALRHLDETHGGTLPYLRQVGVDDATLARVRAQLLLPA